jgi:autotransporter-associated beta strand protein
MGSLNGSSALGLINQSGANQTFSLAVANTGNDSTWRTDIGSTTTLNGAVSLTTGSSSVNRNLYLSGAGNWNIGGAIGNGGTATSGTVSITATGTTTFSGNNTYDGRTTMNATGGTLTLSGDNSGAAGGMRVFAGTVNVNSANALGTGTLTLDGAGTTINNTSGAAVTNLGNNAVVWDGNLGTGFTFGTSASTSANYNLNLGTGTVTAASARTMTFVGSGTTLTMGTLDSTTTSASAITFTINGAGNTLTLGGYKIRSLAPSSLTAVSDSLAGTANLTINGAIIDGNAYANGLKIKGTGTTTFSGNNTYTGVTDVTSGAYLKLGSSTALGSAAGATSVSSGGLLDLNGQTIAETLNYTGTGGLLNSAAGAATVSGVVDIASGMTVNTTGDITLSGKLTGSSNKNLTKSGAGTLKFSAGNSDFAGTSTVSEGTLLVTSAGNVSTSSSIVNNGGTLRVNGTAGGVTVNIGGSLEGSGTVGTTTVAGTLSPGNSPGILNVNGNLTMASGGNMVWELFANTATQASPAVFDQVLVSGALAFAGSNGITLNFGTTAAGSTVSWSDSFWNSNQSFLIYDVAGSTTGFSNLSLLNTSFNDATGAALAESQGSFSVSQLGSDVFLNYNAIPEPSTGSMLGLGFAGLVVTRLLRRKIS